MLMLVAISTDDRDRNGVYLSYSFLTFTGRSWALFIYTDTPYYILKPTKCFSISSRVE